MGNSSQHLKPVRFGRINGYMQHSAAVFDDFVDRFFDQGPWWVCIWYAFGVPLVVKGIIYLCEWSKATASCLGVVVLPTLAALAAPRDLELKSSSIPASMAPSGVVFALHSFQRGGCDWLLEAPRVSRYSWANSSMTARPLSSGTRLRR